MKLFLTKYYLLEKKILPNPITLETIESLAKKDVPGIFMALPVHSNSLNDAQKAEIINLRNQLLQEYDYTPNWMVNWQNRFEIYHGRLDIFLSGFGWVTVVQGGVSVRAQGNLWVWRVRTGEKPLCFQNYNGIEATLPNDVWLLTWAKENVQPCEGEKASEVPLNYAEKLEEKKTDKERFDVLSIERQIDTDNQVTIPLADEITGERVLTIVKRMIAAKLPFAVFEPFLKSLSNHIQFGKVAKDLLKKHTPKDPNEVSPLRAIFNFISSFFGGIFSILAALFNFILESILAVRITNYLTILILVTSGAFVKKILIQDNAVADLKQVMGKRNMAKRFLCF